MSDRHVLTPEQLADAWTASYRIQLDALPDAEIRWEGDVWRTMGAESVAAIAYASLAERRAANFVLPGGADAADLDRLLRRIDIRPVLRLCRDEALPLVDAMRLVFWAGLREVSAMSQPLSNIADLLERADASLSRYSAPWSAQTGIIPSRTSSRRRISRI